MKEPDDQDTDGGRSRSDGKHSSRSDSKQAPEDTTDDLYTDEEESYLDDDFDLEDMGQSTSSFQEFLQMTSLSQEPPPEIKEEAEESIKKKISESFFYNYEELVSTPYVTPEAKIPLDFLTLQHSFGYDCKKRANLQLLDSSTLLYIAGNQLVLLNFRTKEQMYLQSSSGQGIGAIGVHPDKTYFIVAEKGSFPKIIIYEYPSLRPYRILRDGTEKAYAYVDFNSEGTLLASVGSHPDYTITIWNWKEEQPTLRTKAFSQDVFKVTFNPEDDEQLTTSGLGHIKFWEMAFTFTGLKLQGSLGRFGKTTTSDIEGYTELPDGKCQNVIQEDDVILQRYLEHCRIVKPFVLSGSEWGNLLLWEGSLIKVELCRTGMKSCHQGPINQIMLDEGEVITAGSDGCVRIWDFETIDTADIIDDTGLLEIEPINELQVDKNVNLFSMIKMNEIGNNFWLAQDASGAIWKLDLSFSNITQDPECLFSFHSGGIEGLAVSPLTYLMATTALDCSVRIYDFASKTPLVQMKFRQGGTSITWVPLTVSCSAAQLVIGFQDGVVRLLELYDPKGVTLFAGRKKILDAELHLKKVFKPHTAEVTALAYDRDGEILATGTKMVKERCQKKSFQDSLEDIKKRMKEKRNKNLAEVGRRKSFIVAPCQVPTNTATLLKNYQDNNRLLVLALENEKSKVREAQDIILQLRRECYYLACQLYTVKEKLTSQQSEDIDQNRKGCISEVVSSSDNTIGDLSVKTLQQTALEENDWPFQTKEPSSTVPPDTLGSDFDSGKVEPSDDILPKTVSFRRHLKKDFSNVSCSTALEDCEASHWVGQSLEVRRSGCKDPTITLHELENVEQNVCLWNKDQISLSPRLTYPGTNAKTKVILPSESEQTERKHQRAQKRAKRRRANQKCKSKPSLRCKGKKSKDKHTLQPTKLDRSIGSGDAYDFNVEERVHLTPFRQKMSNGSSEEINSGGQEGNASDLSASEDESSDTYLPPCKHLIDHTRESDRPVTRPRPKRELKYMDEKDKEKTLPTRTPTSMPCKNQDLSGCSLKDVTNILLSPVVKIRKLSLSPKRREDSPAMPLPKRKCSTITSYKEPTLASKLRRGDPFTDLCFLDSPIFKQKKDMRRPKRSTKHTQ